MGFFFIPAVVAARLGLSVVTVRTPWNRVPPETRVALMERFAGDASTRVEAAATTAKFGPETFVNIVPRNPIDAAAKTDMLGVIFFGLMFGAALTLIPAAKAKPMVEWLEALNEVVIKIIHFAMMLAPYGVACLIFAVSSRFGFDLMVAVAAFVVTVLIALILHVVITLCSILQFGLGLSPLLFVSRVKAALILSLIHI